MHILIRKCPNTNEIISVTGSYKCGYAFLQIDPTVIAYIIMHSTKYAFNLFSVIAKCLNKWSVMLLPCQLTSSQKKLCYCVLKEGWFNPNAFNRWICKSSFKIFFNIVQKYIAFTTFEWVWWHFERCNTWSKGKVSGKIVESYSWEVKNTIQETYMMHPFVWR